MGPQAHFLYSRSFCRRHASHVSSDGETRSTNSPRRDAYVLHTISNCSCRTPSNVPPPHGRRRASCRGGRLPPVAPLPVPSLLRPHVRDGRADDAGLVTRQRLPARRGLIRSHEMPTLLVHGPPTSRQCASPPRPHAETSGPSCGVRTSPTG